METQKLSHYHSYIQPRYHLDEDFRQTLIGNSQRYIEKHKHDEEYKAKRREISRLCYEKHKEEYREVRRLYAARKRLEAKLNCINSDSSSSSSGSEASF